jgi:hypothetical protein
MIFGAIGGMKFGRGNRSTRRKPTPAPLRPPQNPTRQTRSRTPDRSGGKPATNRLSYGAAFLVPFRHLLRLAGSRWRYSTPPPHELSLHHTEVKRSALFSGGKASGSHQTASWVGPWVESGHGERKKTRFCYELNFHHVGSEVMKSTLFCDITPCSLSQKTTLNLHHFIQVVTDAWTPLIPPTFWYSSVH